MNGMELRVGRYALDGAARQLFPPQHPTGEAAAQELQALLGAPPHTVGFGRSRWWLAGIAQAVPWLNHCSLSGIWRLLRRLRLHYKRGRDYVHSPDPAYGSKLVRVAWLRQLVQQQDLVQPGRFVMLYEDEFTFYRQPTRGANYVLAGSDAPRAQRSHRHNSTRRIAAALDIQTGSVFAWQRSRFDRATLIRYWQALDSAYPNAQRIWVVVDNWPVHFHPDVLAALAHTKIRLVPLPTYAPWTNPVEKFWHKLNQQILHLHPFSDQWELLIETIQHFLDSFSTGSQQLLYEVGLLDY